MYRLIRTVRAAAAIAVAIAIGLGLGATARAQAPSPLRFGAKVPADVKRIYERGLNYLALSQAESGVWPDRGGVATQGQHGVTALCLIALLAGGEDPNHGRYRVEVHRALRSLISSQNPDTGYIPNSMYHHGFAMLALAEAYGAVDDESLWSGVDAESRGPSIGEALELAVRCATTAQDQNAFGAWRYAPTARDADTSVSGAVMVGLLAARNAGIEVPDKNVDTALDYFKSMTTNSGYVNYSGATGMFGESLARSSIATLAMAIGKRKDWNEYALAATYLKDNIDAPIGSNHPLYTRYYMAQALFQADYAAWQKWNEATARTLKAMQNDDGSFDGSYGRAYGTAMSLLPLALNYRFLPIYER